MACIDQKLTDQYAIYNGDSAEILPAIPSESVGNGFTRTVCDRERRLSYNYSSSVRTYLMLGPMTEAEHYEFIVSEVSRTLMLSRISAVHCMDVPKQGSEYRRVL